VAYYIRPMHKEDVKQVTEIDREAFPTQWPAPSYQHELQNRLAHYIVACDDDRPTENAEAPAWPVPGQTGLRARLGAWFGRRPSPGRVPPGTDYVAGFVGFWVMSDEAHITSIAVREAYRRRGIGEQLLISAIDLARELRARFITLEVRASNTVAQSLYTKYGFSRVSVRKGYYIDNKEDALLMSTQDIASAAFQTHFQQLRQAHG